MAETTLLDITSDYIFKLVFGNKRRKGVLISLLNAIFEGEIHIRDLAYQNPEISKILKDGKSVRFDVRADIGEERYIDIEMQASCPLDTIDRSVQYIGEMLNANTKRPKVLKESLPEGSKIDYRYPRVVGIWFFAKNITARKSYFNEGVFTFLQNELDDYEIMTKKARIIFIELQKYKPKNENRRKLLDAWLRFLKNPTDIATHKVPEIGEAFESLQEVSEDPKVREEYRAIMDGERDVLYQRNAAIREAIKEERAKAEAEKKNIIEKSEAEKKNIILAARKEKISSAKKLLITGISADVIAAALGLSAEEIENLKN